MNNALFPQTSSDLMHHSQFYGDMTSLSRWIQSVECYLIFLAVDPFSVMYTK